MGLEGPPSSTIATSWRLIGRFAVGEVPLTPATGDGAGVKPVLIVSNDTGAPCCIGIIAMAAVPILVSITDRSLPPKWAAAKTVGMQIDGF